MKLLIKLLALAFLLLLASSVSADDRIELLENADDGSYVQETEFILQSSWDVADPYGEFDPSLGAAGALNRALGLVFRGHASREQIQMEENLVSEIGFDSARLAPFAVEVLDKLQSQFPEAFPSPVSLKPFDMIPSETPRVLSDNPHLVAVKYYEEEYLERLLQRLYFKLIQGPVLMTVPYRGDSPDIPEEYRNWNNFRYQSNSTTMIWDDTRIVWVDWNLIQTVVLMYENGKIACYDHGKKYYIDHTAAVAAAGAMFAYPHLQNLSSDAPLNFVLTSEE